MQAAYHLAGGAPLLKKLKMGAAIANPGVVVIAGVTTAVGVIIATTTSAANAYGLALDQATYSSTQGAEEGIVTVDVRPDLVVKALMSGGATENTALTVLQATSASAGGTTLADADVGSADMDGGILWGLSGNNVGLSRSITAHTGGTSVVVTVPFPRAIATSDEYLFAPYNWVGTGGAGADGPAAVQGTTLITQADASIASATGMEASVVDLELKGRSDSYVLFVLRDHVHNSAALAS
jgi:hypothetical protein